MSHSSEIQQPAPSAAILVVEDDPELGATLTLWLSRRGYQAHWAADADSALAQAERHPYQVAVIDYKLPDMTGLDLLALLCDRHPDLAVVFLSGEGTMDVAITALREGRAFDFLKKPLLDMELLRVTIDKALASRAPTPPTTPARKPNPKATTTPLSPREEVILALLAEGHNNATIAERLGRTEKTIRNQLSHIYVKLGVESRTQAVLAWQRCGQVS